jgi:hypothetical protein
MPILVKRTSWDHPCCERCWINRSSKVTDEGVEIKRPTIVRDPPIERCHWCNLPTIMGIYVRFDPERVPFPEINKPLELN